MPLIPTVGRAGGQKYDVAKAIRTFLEQMAGGAGFSFGGAVIKELIQNADDAGATELVVALDERNGHDLPVECRDAFGPLLEPALLVRNDARFRIAGEVPDGDQDDFTAICEVAGGHKRFNPTAAGRFGIGFNSVYFLTDTPVLFSRREVHLFDLRRLMFPDDGWRFSLDDFPATASNAGPIKTVLEWALPKAVLGDSAFQEIASDGRHYQRTVFRLPLRRTVSGGSSGERGPVFPGTSFPGDTDRSELIRQMCEEARRSMLFLKSLRRVTFGGIAERRFDEWVSVEAVRQPSDQLERFVTAVHAMRAGSALAGREQCSFRTDLSVRVSGERISASPGNASYQVTHVADFTKPDLIALSDKLLKNGERAVPWVAFATPLDAASFDWEGPGDARWRVFLPLSEMGPSASVVNAAVFVDPSRRAIEFRTDGSDETQRKSLWNCALVEQLLSPLLREASFSIIESAPQLAEQEPKKYLSLFPVSSSSSEAPTSLADVVRASFARAPWLLKLYDLWKEPFDLWLGPSGSQIQIERVPERLARYRAAFRLLSTDARRFVAWNVADALSERLSESEGVEVKKIGADVADHVLIAADAPQAKDLEYLLKLLGDSPLGTNELHGRWAFQQEGQEGPVLRFDAEALYFVRTKQTPPVYDAIAAIGISPMTAEWVAAGIGLRALPASRTESLTNVFEADAKGALELLRRVGDKSRHDLVSNANTILPIVEFLCSQSAPLLTTDLRLAFLVKTASGKTDRRRLGVVFLRPEQPTPDETDLWQGLLRGSFAEVDPQFTPPLRRLLAHAPQLLESIGDEDCRVQVASGEILDVLHAARAQDADFVRRTASQLDEDVRKEGDRRFHVYRAARLVLREADKRWESLDQAVRDTVLAMPLHRGADGAMVSLELVREGASTVADRFFLQSEDDLRDAPIEPRAGQLLHSLDPELRRFYRRRLGIKERNRLEVLKECLRQIGTDAEHSGGILKYIDKYYREALEQLREGGDEAAEDLRELKDLHGSARGVPCVDGVWRRAVECVDARQWRALLEGQNWKARQLDDLLARLCFPQHVATASSDHARAARALWHVQEADQSALAAAAVTSESTDLPFADRVRVVAANLKLLPAMPVARAAVTNAERLSALAGPTDLASLALVDPLDVSLSPDIVRAIVPEAADLAALARTFTVAGVQVLVAVLRAFSVPLVNAATVESRAIANFSGIWSRLATSARLELLEWLGRREAVLPAQCIGLDTVLVQGSPERWLAPATLVAPSWASGSPPNVPLANLARTADIPSHVQRLWNQWCGLRTLETVVSFVVEKTAELPAAQWSTGANRLAGWLEQVAASNKVDALVATLQRLPWVLARKGDAFAFKQSHEVIDHPGAEVLRHEFWVVAGRIPTSLTGHIQTSHLHGTRTVLEAIGRSLSSSASAAPAAARAVYELLTELTSDETATDTWREVATSAPVYRLFRTTGRDPDRLVAHEELFLGDQGLNSDFGDVLVCFGLDDQRRSTRSLYRKLGVRLRPTPPQLVGALARIPTEFREHDVYAALVEALIQFVPADLQDAEALDVSNVKVRSCAKNYQPLDRCYRDADLDRPSRVSPDCRDRLIDLREPANKKLIRWLDEACPGGVLELRSLAAAELTHEPEALDVVAANVLDAWRDWLAELETPGSVVQEEVQKIGLLRLLDPIRVEVVPDIRVRFRLEDGAIVTPSEEWRGLEIFHDTRERLFLRRELVERDFLGQVEDVERLDARIAATLDDLLRARAASEDVPPPSGTLLNVVRTTLERPATVLKRMKDEKEEHFFHQYFDQEADPEFAQLFDTYRRTSASATDRRRAMKQEMSNLIALRFVETRRTQIRGYGYDEFAIFAELVQNAEDAYSQRSQLGLPSPPQHSVTFTYSADAGDRTLSVCHYGRPFNMWRQGAKRIDAFRYDVEGVLKSAGSFKPHTRQDGARPIGRFGLGFKSVYLVTDRPRIHSGDWHFEIAAGAIPSEIAVPAQYEREQTRIVLPLTPGAREDRNRERERFANLLPFLRKVDDLRIDHSDGSTLNLKTTSREVLSTADGHVADRVGIESSEESTDGAIALLRVRHRDHDGQLGVLLGSDGLPVAWNDAFEFDVFAALPLRVHLDCGVGVSNLFEVQSGRTHMIDPAANAPRVAEVARALPAMVKSLLAADGPGPGAVTSRFWSIWRWDRGDEEARPLRVEMAKALAALARSAAVVPTLDPAHCVKLNASALFTFENIPEDFANELIRGAVEFPVGATRVKLDTRNVVPEGTIAAIVRTYGAAQDRTPIGVSRIGWSELGEVFLAKPWLADRPPLVSAMARSLPPERIDQVRPWLSKCLFRAADGTNLGLGQLLPPRFPGVQLLPSRLLVLLDDSYDEQATSLLKQVGLPSRPPLEAMKKWISAGLDRDECAKLLQYLSEAGRWRRDYYELGQVLRSPWFCGSGRRLTTAEALSQQLIKLEDLDTEPAFRAWLGIDSGPIQITVEQDRWDRPVSDPQRALAAIWDWWSAEGDQFVRRYEERTYPDAEPPRLTGEFVPQDTIHRQNWLSLMILASLQTMGRTNPEQHRNFLRQCARQGWLDVFADPRLPADDWIGILERYLGSQTYDIPFYHWVRQFVSIYQLSRWLPEYVWSFLDIEKATKRFDLDRVTRPAHNSEGSGGGASAPPLTRALGIGACFVVRELVRAGVLRNQLSYDHAYVAVGRVRYVFARLGMVDLRNQSASYQHSRQIRDFLLGHLGPSKADFNRCFDLPFLAIAEDPSLQERFLECRLPSDDETAT